MYAVFHMSDLHRVNCQVVAFRFEKRKDQRSTPDFGTRLSTGPTLEEPTALPVRERGEGVTQSGEGSVCMRNGGKCQRQF